jgi:hypothetical protein
MTKPCAHCGREFESAPRVTWGLYCSQVCAHRAFRVRGGAQGLKEKQCAFCQAPFISRRASHVYCSLKCTRRVCQRNWFRLNRDNLRARKWGREKLKLGVLGHYSNGTLRCACCGVGHLPFLTLDHINQDGREHRRQLKLEGRGTHIYHWARKHGYPPIFRVLCYNCNIRAFRKAGRCDCRDVIRLAEFSHG